jgi:hypothetical protein
VKIPAANRSPRAARRGEIFIIRCRPQAGEELTSVPFHIAWRYAERLRPGEFRLLGAP